MTTNLIDDRPIQPNKQYLQQKQQQYKTKKQITAFLKGHQFHDKVLPCFRKNLQQKVSKQKIYYQNQKSKAEIYEQIKKKNRQTFGEFKKENNKLKTGKQVKKLDPKKMTIQYKPKRQILIDTKQYKIQQKNVQKSSHSLFEVSKQETAKQKYEKLLQIIKKQKQELNQQKEYFQKHKDLIEFKKMVSKQNSVPFINEIKKIITQQKSLLKQKKSRKQFQNQEQLQSNIHLKHSQKQNTHRYIKQTSPTTFHPNITQQNMNKLLKQKQQIQNQIVKVHNKNILIKSDTLLENNDVISCKKYSIEQANKIPNFDVECFKEFIDLKTLYPEENQFYKIAIKVFETGLSAKEQKVKLKVHHVEHSHQELENDERLLNSVNFKRRHQGNTRITKYNNGWVEVWNPGVQRLMANSQLSYKVVWLRNGDIKQQWKDKKVISYYSKQQEIVQINFQKNEPIYFFVKLNQFEQYVKQKEEQNKVKTVMFKDGRIERFYPDNNKNCFGN